MDTADVQLFVVENEPLALETLGQALEDAGFSVTTASSGEDALRLMELQEYDFRALITDIDLGGKISGWVVARRGRELNPALPVVYMTGGSASDWSANGVPESVLLTKPFILAQVVMAVTQLLNVTSSALPPPSPPHSNA